MDRKAGWMRWVLIGSLALNLLVVGLLAGAMLRPGGFSGRPPQLGDGVLTRALSEADRTQIRDRLRGLSGDLRAGRREATEALTLLTQALRAEPYDADAVAGLLEQMRSGGRDIRAQAHAALLGQIAGMSPDERSAFADRLEAELARPAARRRP